MSDRPAVTMDAQALKLTLDSLNDRITELELRLARQVPSYTKR